MVVVAPDTRSVAVYERQSRFRGRDTPKPRHIFDILNDGRFKKAH